MQTQRDLNKELEKLSKWFESNKLSINTKKTHYIVFTLSKNVLDTQIAVKINETPIEKIKFLGVYLDDKLNWATNINHICGKLRKGNCEGIYKK